MKNVVVIGGGSGQAALLKGLKQIKNINLSTIVTVADDGGSTGRLRADLHMPVMGDIRNVMMALAESEDLMSQLMNYRFDEHSGEMSGHSLGNIIMAALALKSGSLEASIADLSKILKVKGNIYPSTFDNVELCAHMKDGSIIEGEHNITQAHKQVSDVFYKQPVVASKDAIRVINEADYIIIGIGSVYTSILPNLIIDGIREALVNCKAKVIYYCNSMTECGETDNFSLEEHVAALERQVGKEFIDIVVFADDEIPEIVLESYAKEMAEPVKITGENHEYEIYRQPLLSFKNNLVRHEAGLVKKSFENIMGE